MATPSYYSGPGKVFYTIPGTATIVGLQPRDTNGQIKASVDVKTTTVGAAMYGDMFETTDDISGKISTTPFDNWALLTALFPTYLGVTTTGGNTGSLSIGKNPHDPLSTGSSYPCGAYCADGSIYSFVRGAITKPPNMKFGPGEKLYGDVEISCLGQLSIGGSVGLPGQQGFLMSAAPQTPIGNPITEPGANADPDTSGFTVTPANFAQSHWIGNWGNIWTGIEAEDGWTLTSDVKFNTYTTQRVTRYMSLASARFMISGRPVGIGLTHTSLLSYILGTSGSGGFTSGGIAAQLSGGNFSTSAFNLVLTSSSGRTVTLVNCTPKQAPFEIGGTKLRLGEVGFVQTIVVASSAASPSLIFSA